MGFRNPSNTDQPNQYFSPRCGARQKYSPWLWGFWQHRAGPGSQAKSIFCSIKNILEDIPSRIREREKKERWVTRGTRNFQKLAKRQKLVQRLLAWAK